jgi:YgiT-type zinc finger domain-containing protein
MKLTRCPTCGSQRLRKVRRDLAGEHHGQPYTVAGLEFHECPDCGERVYDRAAMRRIQATSPAFAKTDLVPH